MNKKIILKTLSFLMAIIFVFGFCLPVGADFNLALEGETSGTELSREAKDEIQLNLELGELVFEVESLREENIKHFRLFRYVLI